MPAKGDRGAEREVPLGGARNSAVLGKEGGPGGESDRAIVARKPGNSGGAKGPAFWRASEAEEGQAIDMSLKTPEKVRNLQKKLYLKAKQEPNFRFYQLWDLGQGLARGHSRARLPCGEGQQGCGGSGRRDVSADRIPGPRGVAGKPARRLALEELPASAGAAGDDSQARRRPASARHPDHPGPGGADGTSGSMSGDGKRDQKRPRRREHPRPSSPRHAVRKAG